MYYVLYYNLQKYKWILPLSNIEKLVWLSVIMQWLLLKKTKINNVIVMGVATDKKWC